MEEIAPNFCPCCSNKPYSECCKPIIDGTLSGASAEAVVRARYSAFALKQLDYVENTHAPEVRDDFNRAEAERIADTCEWQKLHIHKVKDYGEISEVEFVVKVRHEDKLVTKASASRFRKIDGEWFFVSSKAAPHIASMSGPKVGRNDMCPCGSGIKFKKCCEARESSQT